MKCDVNPFKVLGIMSVWVMSQSLLKNASQRKTEGKDFFDIKKCKHQWNSINKQGMNRRICAVQLYVIVIN